MRLLRPSEVAHYLAVDPKTVTRWAKLGKINYVTTPGGHRRFHADVIRKMIHDTQMLDELNRTLAENE